MNDQDRGLIVRAMEQATEIVTSAQEDGPDFDRRADRFLDGIGAGAAAVLCRELVCRYGPLGGRGA